MTPTNPTPPSMTSVIIIDSNLSKHSTTLIISPTKLIQSSATISSAVKVGISLGIICLILIVVSLIYWRKRKGMFVFRPLTVSDFWLLFISIAMKMKLYNFSQLLYHLKVVQEIKASNTLFAVYFIGPAQWISFRCSLRNAVRGLYGQPRIRFNIISKSPRKVFVSWWRRRPDAISRLAMMTS